MRTNIYKLLTPALVAMMALLALPQTVSAQDNQSSSSTLTRRTGGPSTRKKNAEPEGPQVTERMQAFYEDNNATITDADRQWMRVIYRELDLDNDRNASLYFPEDIVEDQENLFRIIMRLLANGQLKAYEYLDGREVFNDENLVNVGEMLDRFSIMHTDAKGSTQKAPRYTIHPSDVPTNEVLSYYIIEQWEFDTRANKTRTVVQAICPVLHRAGDFGGEAVRYPMFWIRFNDIRPWLAQQQIFIDDDNNLPTATYDDFFTLNMYEGDIYKTRNLKNKSMTQLYPDPEQRKLAQDSIQNRLTSYDSKLWVPDREEILAANTKAKTKKSEAVASDTENTENVEGTEEQQPVENTAKRTTKRSAKKTAPKQTKVKETKVKSSSASNAARSVRRRK